MFRAGDSEDAEVAGCTGDGGRLRERQLLGAANIDPGGVRERRSTCASTATSTATSRSAAACTVASARTSPGASCRITLREWHRRIPEYEVKPGIELHYPPGLREVENLELVWKT